MTGTGLRARGVALLTGCCTAALLQGCGEVRAPQPGRDGCDRCHGTGPSGAPPVDLLGRTDPAGRGVGAHEIHLAGSAVSGPIACGTCHVVPDSVGSEGHLEGGTKTRVRFTGLAVADGAVPETSAPEGSGDAAADSALPVSCATTYCHGATLGGGSATTPVWNPPDAKHSACGACHGTPPPAPHPASGLESCVVCHAQTVAADGTIADREKHVDGVVQVTGSGSMACNGCHGSEDNPAPPRDASGGTDTALATVGAHQAHLGATLSRAVACAECHVVPAAVGDAGHLDGGATKVAFGTLARTDGAAPAWERAGETCASTYCHGASLSGGSNTRPKWTQVDGSQDACGSCHGVPPPAPHPASTLSQCQRCHPETMAPDGSIAHPDKHIDGQVQSNGGTACNACHGSAASAAPPRDASGGTSTALVGVGAHQAHLGATTSRPVACGECHVVPSSVGAPGHQQDSADDVKFGALSRSDGAAPSWDQTAATCTTYCHGATLAGGTNRSPRWTQVDGSQDACGTCHGLPPTGTTSTLGRPFDHAWGDHERYDCSDCHPQTAAASGGISGPTYHVDGAIQVGPGVASCTASGCHD